MLSQKEKIAMHAWENSTLTEFSEAPLLVRSAGVIIVALSIVFTLLG